MTASCGYLLVAQTVKHLPAMQETQLQSLGQKDPLEKEMATHSSILAWRIPWTKKPGRLQSMGLQRVGHNWVTLVSLFISVGRPWLLGDGSGPSRRVRRFEIEQETPPKEVFSFLSLIPRLLLSQTWHWWVLMQEVGSFVCHLYSGITWSSQK